MVLVPLAPSQAGLLHIQGDHLTQDGNPWSLAMMPAPSEKEKGRVGRSRVIETLQGPVSHRGCLGGLAGGLSTELLGRVETGPRCTLSWGAAASWASLNCPPPSFLVSWKVGPWTPCSVSCGGGVQSRSVYCISSDGTGGQEAAEETQCAGLVGKPPTTQACNLQHCAVWSVEPWGEVRPCLGLGAVSWTWA